MIRKHTILNAAQFKEPNPKAILGKVLQEQPELKNNIKQLQQDIQEEIEQVLLLSKEDIQKEASNYEVKKREIKHIEPIKDAIYRFSPSPSGALHIGHAYTLALNAKYAEKGTLLLRIEDTNPENIYPDAYDLIKRDAEWLTNIDKIVIQSDRLEQYYSYARTLVEQEDAYVCTCNPDEFREFMKNKKPCPCRSHGLEQFNAMFSTYKPGEAVLRMKTDVTHKNPAMRDFPLMRINEHPHARTETKYRVWPLMNFSVAIDDLDVTHSIRGKDHMDNEKRQRLIHQALNKPSPQSTFIGRINFTGLPISSSEVKMRIERGEFTGWDDIRLPFLPALKRRGYHPEALKNFALSIGTSQTDKTVSKEEFYKTLNAHNKKLLELSNRYFIVRNPEKVTIHNMLPKEVKISLHPDYPERGSRSLTVKDTIYIEREDLLNLEEERIHRLIDCCNIVVRNNQIFYASDNYELYKNAQNKGKIIHWLPEDNIPITIKMPDNTNIQCLGESSLTHLPTNTTIQGERVGFMRVDNKEPLTCWFAHT